MGLHVAIWLYRQNISSLSDAAFSADISKGRLSVFKCFIILRVFPEILEPRVPMAHLD